MVQIDRCFGFDTAVEEAQRALLAAKVEASSAYKGVGLVKLMGRQSGFIAMQASMASGVVDVCLIPEVGGGLGEATAVGGLIAMAVRVELEPAAGVWGSAQGCSPCACYAEQSMCGLCLQARHCYCSLRSSCQS